MREDSLTAPIAEPASGRVAASNAATEAFFAANADAVAHACAAMAARFRRGGRLLVHGNRARRSDVAHVVVEFLHPVVVGKRALPAIAVPTRESLDVVGRDADILLVFSATAPDGRGLVAGARSRGMLTLCLSGEPAGDDSREGGGFHFVVPSGDACVVQETHEVLYHVLWELVHVFLEHRGAET